MYFLDFDAQKIILNPVNFLKTIYLILKLKNNTRFLLNTTILIIISKHNKTYKIFYLLL